MINLDDALGVHPMMLQYRTERTAVLASNIANVDTPNYKAKDLTFNAVMSSVSSDRSLTLETDSLYRIPVQRTRDGNTVELHSEQARFAQNSMEYQQSLQFLKAKVSGLKRAIEGQ
ncbi:flagellar basal-body rod protein FlgB [Vibrio xiamenensis]|uniref:Flagellar basal body rod protein FlgB n=1 Tax=Vibrio xiamenensis TaxID=861298 RepID=A0A1G7ZYW3_9VIBR|nr:flagellar basal body protein [Vibrio xiamenensis]SDH13842.1 flagellar basal-body rod protein FlgB [Vibrio xiamenensis]